jgi:hypothetical protein
VIWSQNHSDGFSRFGFKTGGDGFFQFDFKTGGNDLSRFSLKTGGSGFFIWPSKLAATVWWFEPQNHRDDFLVYALK